MPGRVSLPGADELFRGTGRTPSAPPDRPRAVTERTRTVTPAPTHITPAGSSSGRVRHESKITVYVTEDELLGLEQARLRLRGEHGIAADRGRLVREAIDIALADLAANGPDAELVRRLAAS